MKKVQKILSYCGDRWNKEFRGISSLEASRDLDMPHGEVREIFKTFRDQNKGSLNDGILLPKEDGNDTSDRFKQYISTIFYPGKEVLDNYFTKSEYAKKHLPVFRNKLHQGHYKTEMMYFSDKVLNRYLENPDRYNIQDIVWGGFLSSNLEYISKLSAEENEKKCCSTTRYGKIKQEDGQYVVSAILEDLAALPEEEQRHWNDHLIEDHISAFDPDFHKYYLRFYEGAPVDSHDPMHDLLKTLQKINNLPQLGTLFKNLKSENLSYPIQNTKSNYYDACRRLHKIIGLENLDTNILKGFLQKNFNLESTNLENEKLYPTFLEMVGYLEHSIDHLNDTITNNELLEIETPESDYLVKFKKMCNYLFHSYSILHQKLIYDSRDKEKQVNLS